MRDEERQQTNLLILECLMDKAEHHLDLRFGQILVNLWVIEVRKLFHSPTDWEMIATDPFYEEALARMPRRKELPSGAE